MRVILSGYSSKICVIGIWHLGSIVSACLADAGYTVIGVDRNHERVEKLNQGIAPLYEPGLNQLLKRNIELKRLSFTTNLKSAVKGARYVIITFDTPVDAQDEVDISEVLDTCRNLAENLENDSIIVVSSQVPVGTCDEIKSIIKEHNSSLEFDVAYSPENLRLGQAIECFRNPDRIIIGADKDTTIDKVEQLFSVILAPKLRMSLRSAEMTKHALNAFLATSISFINEIANLCDEVGADAMEVSEGLRTDQRIGRRAPLHPGIGFSGGHLARDLKILKGLGKKFGYKTHLIDGVLKVNEEQNKSVARKLERIFGSLRGLSIGVLGLTYKPGTSTLHRSAALEIIGDLVDRGAIVKAHDPKAVLEEIQLHKEFKFCKDPYEVAEGSDALIMVTEWPEYKQLDFELIKTKMKRPILFDAKNMLDDKLLTEKGFKYFGIGRGRVTG
jgi:UDPglucose 6-dehydrogenase